MHSSSKDSPISILGAGAFGLSTALHLQRAGYSNITVFDRASQLPSPYSAGYDLNKIVRAEYENEFYTDLALEAIEGWKTPLFAPYYHQTGYIVACSGAAPAKAQISLSTALASVLKHPAFKDGIDSLSRAEGFRKHAWQLSGNLDGYTGYFNRLAGYAHSANAMKAVAEHLSANGVRFILAHSGEAKELLYHTSAGSRRCIGVKTADGKAHFADLTICALGGYGANLVPELGCFSVARCWSVAHVQLTEQECDLLRGLPVVNVRDLGFFFEPDPATRLFKLCPLGAGYSNDQGDGTSLPPPDLESSQDMIPVEDEAKLRRLLEHMLPWMADRPFVDKKMCWFSDSKDSEYCIDFVPRTDNSLVVLSGDSGHSFKMMPVMGKWVVDLIEQGQQSRELWRWRAEDVANPKRDWADAVTWRNRQISRVPRGA